MTGGQTIEEDGGQVGKVLECQAKELGLHSVGTGEPSMVFEQGRDQSSTGGGNKTAGGKTGCRELRNDGEGLSPRSHRTRSKGSRAGEQEVRSPVLQVTDGWC